MSESSNRPSSATGALVFARNFFKHPRMLGSVIPSSRYLINDLIRSMEWDSTKLVVEYGPGVGTITGEMLKHLPGDGKMVVIETNPDFIPVIKKSLPDQRLHVVHGSAADVDHIIQDLGFTRADYIVSGIPFSIMPAEVRDDILQKTHNTLSADGAFVVYQFTTSVLPHLRQVFGSVRRGFEPRNIPPAQLFVCRPKNMRDCGFGASSG